MAGRRAREGIGRRGGRNGLQGHYCFLRFLRPPDECKNPDWSDLINYLIRHPDWSVIQEHWFSPGLLAFIRELKHARFWDADGNRKRTLLVLGKYRLRDSYTTPLEWRKDT